MKRIHLLLIFVFLAHCTLYGQSGKWYFGSNAALEFGVTPPGGTPTIFSPEGSAIVYDQSGNVIFYTDGTSVRNGNHVLQFAGLLGNISSTQNVVVVPSVCSVDGCNRYFIFTVDATENDFANGWNVTQVEVTGTAPATTVTALPGESMLITLPTGAIVGEKITVAEDNSGGYWVITHGLELLDDTGNPWNGFTGHGDSYFTVHVDNTVCSVTDIFANEQHIGQNVVVRCLPYATCAQSPFNSAGYQKNAGGQLKVNQQNNRTAMAMATDRIVQLTDFNNALGVFSNALTLNIASGCFPANAAFVYGVEFSPDGSLLYASTMHNGAGIERAYQFGNLTGGVPAICATQFDIGATGGTSVQALGALQLGPDDNIYSARNNVTAVGVINDPNNAGAACNYGSISLLSGTSRLGFPQHREVNTTIPAVTLTYDDNNLNCGESATLTVNGCATCQYVWSTGATSSSIVVTPLTSTTYTVTVTTETGCAVDVLSEPITVNPLNITINGDISITCDQSTVLIANGCTGTCTYLWSTGATSAWITVMPQTTTIYTVTVTNAAGCTDVATQTVTVTDCPSYCKYINNTGNDDLGRNVVATSDGGFILVGNLTNGGTNRDLYVVKYNSLMSVQFATKIGVANMNEAAFSVLPVEDGYFIVGTAEITATNSDIVVVKLNPTGGIEASQRFSTVSNDKLDVGRKIVRVFNAASGQYDYFVIGHTNGFGPGGVTDFNVYIIKFTYTQQTFNIVQHKIYGDVHWVENANDAIVDANNSFIYIVGTSSINNTDMYFLRVAPTNLNTFQSLRHGGTKKDIAIGITQLGTSLYIAGTTTSSGPNDDNIYVLKTTTSFGIQTGLVYCSSAPSIDETTTSIIKNSANHLVVTASNRLFNGIIMEIDPSSGVFSTSWSRTSNLQNIDGYNSVTQLTSGLYAVTGLYNEAQNDNEIFISRIKTNGVSCCNTPILFAENLPLTNNTHGTSFNSGAQKENWGAPTPYHQLLTLCVETAQPRMVDIEDAADFLVYPNPNTGSFTIQLDETLTTIDAITIADISGRVIRNISTQPIESGKLTISLPDVSNGIYFVQVKAGGQQWSSRISINK